MVVLGGIESVVGSKFVGDNGATFGNEVLDNGDKGARLSVGNLLRHLVGMGFLLHLARNGVNLLALPNHRHTENGGFRLGAAPLCLGGFLVFVLVGFTSAKVHFVALHSALKNHIFLNEQCAYLVENEPRGFLRNGNVSSQLHGGNALLVAGDEIHRNEPLAEGYLRVLKDSTHRYGEILAAVGATERTVLAGAAIVLPAERANHIILLPTRFKDCLAALFLGVEVGSESKYGVEATEIYHNKIPYVYRTSIYTQNIGKSFTKSRLFCIIVSISYGENRVNWYIVPYFFLLISIFYFGIII